MRDDERRDAARVEILGDLRGEIMVFEPMTISRISEQGVRIETAFQLNLGSLHDLRLTLGQQALVVKGRVVHSNVDDVNQDRVTYRSGIEFVELSKQAATVLTHFVTALAAGRPRGPE